MRVLFTFIILFISVQAFSQRFSFLNDGFVAQHWQHKMYYNAAATGSEQKRIFSVNGSFYGSLSQIDKTSNYYTGLISYEQPFKENSHSSFGLVASYLRQEGYKYGNRYAALASYSYALRLGDEKFLRFGAQAGIIKLEYDFPYWERTRYRIDDEAPIFNAGLFFNSRTFYGGVAIKSINGPQFQSDKIDGSWVDYKEYSKLNIMAGKKFFSDKTFQYKPGILAISDMVATMIHLNSTVYYKNKYSLGTSLLLERINTIAINAGVQLAEKVELSANYEIPTRRLSNSQGLEFSGRFIF